MKHVFLILSLLTAVALVLAACTPGTDDDTRNFNVNIENVGSGFPVLKSGAVASPGGPDDGPAIFPGETATFSFTAPPNTTPMSGMRLNLVTMFVQSNDLFYAFAPEGLALYDENGDAVTGDVTDQLFLYDAGTEEDQVPGANASDNQKPNQTPTETNKGPDENETVQLVENAPTNGFTYPEQSGRDSGDPRARRLEHLHGERDERFDPRHARNARRFQARPALAVCLRGACGRL